MFKNHPSHQARSADTSNKARIRLSEKLIAWADAILVMERKHQQLIKQRFAHLLSNKPITILDIEDNYSFNDPELIEILSLSLMPI